MIKKKFICMTFFLLWLFAIACTKTPLPPKNSDILSIKATSTLKDSKDRYNVKNIVDDGQNSWCEGKSKDGIGESYTISFNKPVKLSELWIQNGFGDPFYWKKNNRVRLLKINTQLVLLKDDFNYQKLSLKKPIIGKEIKFEIAGIYKGTKYRDTCVSNLSFTEKKTDIAIWPYGTWLCGGIASGAELQIINKGFCTIKYWPPSGPDDDGKPRKCTWGVTKNKITLNLPMGKATYYHRIFKGFECLIPFARLNDSLVSQGQCDFGREL